MLFRFSIIKSTKADNGSCNKTLKSIDFHKIILIVNLALDCRRARAPRCLLKLMKENDQSARLKVWVFIQLHGCGAYRFATLGIRCLAPVDCHWLWWLTSVSNEPIIRLFRWVQRRSIIATLLHTSVLHFVCCIEILPIIIIYYTQVLIYCLQV